MNNILDIKTDEDLLFNYRNKESNDHNKYCITNKKENIKFKYNLESNYSKILNSQATSRNVNERLLINSNNKDQISLNNLKKFRSEIMKRENETVMKKYEIYKNSDFEAYEKNYLLEKSEHRSKYKKEEEAAANDNERKDNELNNINITKFPFASEKIKNSNIDFNKILEKIEIKEIKDDVEDMSNNHLKLEKKNDSTKNVFKEQVDKGNNHNPVLERNTNNTNNINNKNENQIKVLKQLNVINFEDLKIREEKYKALRQKLEIIKNHQREFNKKLSDKDLLIKEDSKVILTNQKTIQEKTNQGNEIKIRSISSEVSSSKKAITNSKPLFLNNQNSNSKSKTKNSFKISVEKEIQSLKKSKDSEAKGITDDNNNYIENRRNNDNNSNFNPQNNFNNNNILQKNINSNNNKENISKEFKQVLNSLKIDNILQKTKMIFNKQLTMNSNLASSSKIKNVHEFDLKNIKITSNFILEDEKGNNNSKNNLLRNSLDNLNKKPKSENIMNSFINPEQQERKKTLNDNKSKNNYNNKTSTIIINNNININTFIDNKGDLIYQNEMEKSYQNSKKNHKNNNNNIRSKAAHNNLSNMSNNYIGSEDNNLKENINNKYTNENKNEHLKLIKLRNSEDNFDKSTRINREKLISNINPDYNNLLLPKKASSITKKNMPITAKDVFKNREYSDKNYKNLLLCSYENTVKNSEFEYKNFYQDNKDHERIKDKLKKFESVEKYRIEKEKPAEETVDDEDYSNNFNKNWNNRIQNFENLDYRDANISPSYLLNKNRKRINRPFSNFRSIDFDNKTSGGVDYFLYNNNEKEKTKTKFSALNFLNKHDNDPLRLKNINY